MKHELTHTFGICCRNNHLWLKLPLKILYLAQKPNRAGWPSLLEPPARNLGKGPMSVHPSWKESGPIQTQDSSRGRVRYAQHLKDREFSF